MEVPGQVGHSTSMAPVISAGTARTVAVLCFVGALDALAEAALAWYARAVTADAVVGGGSRLPEAAKSALGDLGTLNLLSGMVNVMIAAAMATGGVLLLRRMPASRIVIAAASAGSLLASSISYLVGSRTWGNAETAMQGFTSVDITREGLGLSGVITTCVLAVVILVLVLMPSTTRWLASRAQTCGVGPTRPNAPCAQHGSVVSMASGAPPTGRTARAAAALTLVGGLMFAAGAGYELISFLNPHTSPGDRVLAAIVAPLSLPLWAGLITGAVLLLRRRVAGQIPVAVTCGAIVLLGLGLLFAVGGNAHRPPGALRQATLIVALAAGYAAATLALALAPATRRWCLADQVGAQAAATTAIPTNTHP